MLGLFLFCTFIRKVSIKYERMAKTARTNEVRIVTVSCSCPMKYKTKIGLNLDRVNNYYYDTFQECGTYIPLILLHAGT